ncbi:MAG TPA: hypothetical protein VEA15_03595 [Caulobacteraceae bacterium]|nr:hypothetical protein [Caulobacteraceae bacterium]
MQPRSVVLAGVFGINLLALGACGAAPAPSSHLSEAVAALRAGDAEAFSTARSGAELALNRVLGGGSPGQFCGPEVLEVGLAAMDRAGTLALDEAAVLEMGEEARFVFAANRVGRGPPPLAEPPPALRRYDRCTGEDLRRAAAADPARAKETRAAGAAFTRELSAWRAALKKEHGEDFDHAMHEAAASLQEKGLYVRWPVEIARVQASAG